MIMLRRELIVGAALSALIAALPARALEGGTAMSAPQKGYAPVNGIDMYYEIHGAGTPLVLLHGGITVYETLGVTLPELARSFQVIVPHLQGHGLTRDVADRPLDYGQLGRDVIALLDHLGIAKAHLVGYSTGAGAALQATMQRPERVDRLVVVSTAFARDGWYPDVVQAFHDMPAQAPQLAAGMAQAPFASSYPDVDWEALFRKTGEMERQPYDWSAEVAKMTTPTMLVFADADALWPDHIVEFYRLLGGGLRDGGLDGSGRSKAWLAILPGTTHYDLNNATAVVEAIVPFLDAP
jgi:pimeloyl-ACP methyl ester carboxylesterase